MKILPAQTKTENTLALTIIEWLEAEGWEVFEEVSPWGNNGHRADLVARKDKILWVIETKNAFNLKLLEQAEVWLPYAHFVSIGIWLNCANLGMVKKVCQKFNVGVITSDTTFVGDEHRVVERSEGFFNRRAKTAKLAKMLISENLHTGNAGKPGHEFFTPYKLTIKTLIGTVNKNPGITIEEALQEKHHYRDDKKAKRNILTKLQNSEIGEITFIKKRGQYLLYPTASDEFMSVASTGFSNKGINKTSEIQESLF